MLKQWKKGPQHADHFVSNKKGDKASSKHEVAQPSIPIIDNERKDRDSLEVILSLQNMNMGFVFGNNCQASVMKNVEYLPDEETLKYVQLKKKV